MLKVESPNVDIGMACSDFEASLHFYKDMTFARVFWRTSKNLLIGRVEVVQLWVRAGVGSRLQREPGLIYRQEKNAVASVQVSGCCSFAYTRSSPHHKHLPAGV